MTLLSTLLLCSMPLLALGMKKRATTEDFELYGYNDVAGGFTLFYADGFAYIGDPAQSNSTDAAPVAFTPSSDNMLIGSPNRTSQDTNSTTPSWSDVVLTIPRNSTTDKRVKFTSSNSSSDDITSDFIFYGSTAMHVGDDGQLESLWFSLQVSDSVSALYWNDTSLGQEPVVLRSRAPSNPVE